MHGFRLRVDLSKAFWINQFQNSNNSLDIWKINYFCFCLNFFQIHIVRKLSVNIFLNKNNNIDINNNNNKKFNFMLFFVFVHFYSEVRGYLK